MTATKLWYPHHIEKYRRKTGHLTIAEHGAYRLLMDAYWDRRGPLPTDETRLRKLIGADKDEWEAVREAVLAFFTETPEGWRHDKIDEQLAEAERLHKAKSERLAKAREAKRLKAEQDKALSTEQATKQDAGLTPATQSPSPSHILTDTEEPDLGAVAPSKKKSSRGTRLADDWRPPPEYLTYAVSQGLSDQEARNEADRFKDHWIAKSGKDASKRDWFATWRNWIRNHIEWRGAQRHPAGTVDVIQRLQSEPEDDGRARREPVPYRQQIAGGR